MIRYKPGQVIKNTIPIISLQCSAVPDETPYCVYIPVGTKCIVDRICATIPRELFIVPELSFYITHNNEGIAHARIYQTATERWSGSILNRSCAPFVARIIRTRFNHQCEKQAFRQFVKPVGQHFFFGTIDRLNGQETEEPTVYNIGQQSELSITTSRVKLLGTDIDHEYKVEHQSNPLIATEALRFDYPLTFAYEEEDDLFDQYQLAPLYGMATTKRTDCSHIVGLVVS